MHWQHCCSAAHIDERAMVHSTQSHPQQQSGFCYQETHQFTAGIWVCDGCAVPNLFLLTLALTFCIALVLPNVELCFGPVVFNCRQHQHQDLMGSLLPLTALSAYRDPHI